VESGDWRRMPEFSRREQTLRASESRAR